MTPFQKRLIWASLVSILMCLGAAWIAKDTDPSLGRWYSIIPPLLAVTMALTTHKVVLSLATAVAVGGFLATVPQAPLSLYAWWSGLTSGVGYVYASATDEVNFQILGFVVLIMIAVSVMITSGGLQGIVNWLIRFAKGVRSSQFVTSLMGLLLFFDDYTNTMVIGNSLRPLTDKYRISREKLAFIVDATAAPVAGIAVISTWNAYQVGLFDQVSTTLGIGRDGYAMFFDALAFRFYCILMIAFVFINALSGRDYGSMAKAQKRSLETGELSDPNGKTITSGSFAPAVPLSTARIYATSALIPIGALLVFFIGGLWIDGGGMGKLTTNAFAFLSFSTWQSVLGASENSILLLVYASGLSLFLASLLALGLSRLTFNEVMTAIYKGIKTCILPVFILILAWSLKGACDGVLTGKFLANTVGGFMSPLLFPALLFIVASLTSFATGTSWGTMAILIPTAIPIAFQLDGGAYGLVTMICLGAVLDGAIFGDHCSPISDTTIMSSISSSCDHIQHVRTQIPYSLTVAGIALVLGYIPAAFGAPAWMGILMGTTAILALFFFLKIRTPDTGEKRIKTFGKKAFSV